MSYNNHNSNKMTIKAADSFSSPAQFMHIAFLLIISLFLLSACGGGAGTEANSGGGGGGGGGGGITTPSYVGPTASNQDIQNFQDTLWNDMRATNRCGQCHRPGSPTPQEPYFMDWTDVNNAYTIASGLVDRNNPGVSRLVVKAKSGPQGHNCWTSSKEVCGNTIANLILAWNTRGNGSGTEISLGIPNGDTPEQAISFPAADSSNFDTIRGYLRTYCSECHAVNQTPLFAVSTPPEQTYNLVKDNNLIDLATPANSRLVTQIQRAHAGGRECWVGTDCAATATTMLTAIQAYIAAEGLVADNSFLDSVTESKAIRLKEGTLASAGSRIESFQIAKFEFNEGNNNQIADTRGNYILTLQGTQGTDYRWVGGFGVEFMSDSARAQADSATSAALHQTLKNGSFSIEAWVIPGNVTQEDVDMINYSNGTDRNYALSQALYNYQFYNNGSTSNGQNVPLETPAAEEVLQASLQHVVLTYTPQEGRKIYVNGRLRAQTQAQEGSLVNWDDSFSLVFGNAPDNSRPWRGTLRLVAFHNQAMSPEDIKNNADIGVGEKYFLLFEITDLLANRFPDPSIFDANNNSAPKFYIQMTALVNDNFSYTFSDPKFRILNIDQLPNGAFPSQLEGTKIKGIRIGVNGREAAEGQGFANIDMNLAAANYDLKNGQSLLQPNTATGTIIRADKGEQPAISDSDQFFVTFELINGVDNVAFYADTNNTTPPVVNPPTDVPDIGVRTFEEIYKAMGRIVNIDPTIDTFTNATTGIYTNYRQQLPATENPKTFVAAHQMAITQLAMAYCDARVNADVVLSNAANQFFTGFNFNAVPGTAFSAAGINQILEPLLNGVMNVDITDGSVDSATNLSSQPVESNIRNLLGDTTNVSVPYSATNISGLINEMGALCTTNCNSAAQTQKVVKGVCGAVLSSAALFVQ